MLQELEEKKKQQKQWCLTRNILQISNKEKTIKLLKKHIKNIK